jgi:hypothetical protein
MATECAPTSSRHFLSRAAGNLAIQMLQPLASVLKEHKDGSGCRSNLRHEVAGRSGTPSILSDAAPQTRRVLPT